jgi:hypothetical protein
MDLGPSRTCSTGVNHSDRAASPYELTIRPLTAADRGSLAELPDRVSPQSAASRFHGAVIVLDGRGIEGVDRLARDAEDADTAEVVAPGAMGPHDRRPEV